MQKTELEKAALCVDNTSRSLFVALKYIYQISADDFYNYNIKYNEGINYEVIGC